MPTLGSVIKNLHAFELFAVLTIAILKNLIPKVNWFVERNLGFILILLATLSVKGIEIFSELASEGSMN